MANSDLIAMNKAALDAVCSKIPALEEELALLYKQRMSLVKEICKLEKEQ